MKAFAALFCLVILSAHLAIAQDFAPLANTMVGMKSVLSRFAENTHEFTGELQFQIIDSQSQPRMQMTMEIKMTGKDMRADCLVASIPQIPSEQRDVMQTLQVDRIALITRIEAKKMYLTFPKLKVFQEFPISDDTLYEIAARSKAVRIEKTIVGQETVNGHPCAKAIVVATETNRPPEKAVVWFASDLKEFPVRIAMGKSNMLQVIEFRNVQLATPQSTAFEIPENYTKLKDSGEILRVAKERFQAGGGQPPTTPRNDNSAE